MTTSIACAYWNPSTTVLKVSVAAATGLSRLPYAVVHVDDADTGTVFSLQHNEPAELRRLAQHLYVAAQRLEDATTPVVVAAAHEEVRA